MNASTTRILIVDDDAELRELLVDTLTEYGFSAQAVKNGHEMFFALREGSFDLVLLDIMMPGEDGLDLCRRLRLPGTPWATLPIIFLSALSDTTDRVVGLELGGDDYLPKPFQPRELVARIRALLRRAGAQAAPQGDLPTPATVPSQVQDTVWAFGPWRLHGMARHLVDADGVVVALSAAEFRLLTLFLEHPQQVVSREQILERVAERGTDMYDRSIDVQISRLRNKLRDNSRNPEIIRTLRGDGYMFIAAVQRTTV